MNLIWDITDNDINRVKDFLESHDNNFVKNRIAKNINQQNVKITRNTILKGVIMCLLTSQQRSGPNSPIAIFLRKTDFPITYESVSSNTSHLENYIREILIT